MERGSFEGRLVFAGNIKDTDGSDYLPYYDNPNDPIGNQMNMYQLKPEDGWQDIEITEVNPDATNGCYLQINAANYNRGALIIDDITVGGNGGKHSVAKTYKIAK